MFDFVVASDRLLFVFTVFFIAVDHGLKREVLVARLASCSFEIFNNLFGLFDFVFVRTDLALEIFCVFDDAVEVTSLGLLFSFKLSQIQPKNLQNVGLKSLICLSFMEKTDQLIG